MPLSPIFEISTHHMADSTNPQPNMVDLLEHYGWKELGERIDIRCFTSNPTISSSLKFLRQTPWAREKVEQLYLEMIGA
jgi:uncharacterized protein (DUF2132 family)